MRVITVIAVFAIVIAAALVLMAAVGSYVAIRLAQTVVMMRGQSARDPRYFYRWRWKQ